MRLNLIGRKLKEEPRTKTYKGNKINRFRSLRIQLVQIIIIAYLILILTTVEITRHAFPIIDSNAICGVNNLKTLLLNDNQISEIRRNAFNDLQDLMELELSGNLLILNLAFNKIAEIDENLFAPLETLEELYLSGNHINEL